jgi:hypothetical protein
LRVIHVAKHQPPVISDPPRNPILNDLGTLLLPLESLLSCHGVVRHFRA